MTQPYKDSQLDRRLKRWTDLGVPEDWAQLQVSLERTFRVLRGRESGALYREIARGLGITLEMARIIYFRGMSLAIGQRYELRSPVLKNNIVSATPGADERRKAKKLLVILQKATIVRRDHVEAA